MRYLRRPIIENNASSVVGPGLGSQGGNMGTGAVVNRDPEEVAKEWVSSIGREPSDKERDAWSRHAERASLSPEDEEKGWAFLTKGIAKREELALATMHKVFGDSASWAGTDVPLKNMLVPDELGVVRRNKSAEKPKLQTMKEALGSPKMHQAPQMGDAGAAAQMANGGPNTGEAPGFPFHTKSAEKIWTFAKLLILTHPEAPPTEIVRLAMLKARLPPSDLTPEDTLLLQLAIEWMQNGPAKTNVRSAGARGEQ